MRAFTTALGALLLLSLLAADANGLTLSEHARHDRLAAESATPVPPGSLEAELGLDYSRTLERPRGFFNNSWRLRHAEKTRVWDWGLSLTYGVMADLDATVAAGYSDIKDRNRPFDDRFARGYDDLDIGAKWRFHQDPAAGLSIAYVPTLTIPVAEEAKTGRLGPGQKFWGLTNRLALTQDMDALTANLDLGYMLPFGRTRKHYAREFNFESVNTRGILDANLGVGFVAHEHFIPEAGLSVAHEFRSRGNDSTAFDAVIGAAIPLTEQVRAKVGLREPLLGRNALRTRSLMVGLAVQFF